MAPSPNADALPTTSGVGGAGSPGGEPRIVVGVDASTGARRALAWAARYAALTGGHLEVVHAWRVTHEFAWVSELPPPAAPTETAERALAELVSEEVGPGVDVDVEVVEGSAGRVLVERARGADALVVGSRGGGGFDGLTLGSVGAHCAAHAPCTVIVVRPPGEAP